MDYMTCTTCRKIVIVNPTGSCLGCQSGFSKGKFSDQYVDSDSYKTEKKIQELKDKKEALELELQAIAPRKRGRPRRED